MLTERAKGEKAIVPAMAAISAALPDSTFSASSLISVAAHFGSCVSRSHLRVSTTQLLLSAQQNTQVFPET